MTNHLKTKAKPKVRVGSSNSDLSDYIYSEYIKLLDKEKELKERKRELLDEATAYMKKTRKTELAGKSGKFMRIIKTSYSWKLDEMKKSLGRQWTAYVKPDEKMLRAKMGDSIVSSIAHKEEKQVTTFVRS